MDGVDVFDALSGHELVDSVLSFTADLVPVSKSNHRHDREGKGSWGRFAGFEELIATHARQVKPASWPQLDKEVPLVRRPVAVVAIAASTTLDAANLPKSVTDGLEGVCFVSDASALAVLAVTRRSKSPGLCVVVASCSPSLRLLPVPERTLASVGSLALEAAVELFVDSFPSPAVRRR
jgi:hypothetical protein